MHPKICSWLNWLAWPTSSKQVKILGFVPVYFLFGFFRVTCHASEIWEQTPGYGVSEYFDLESSENLSALVPPALNVAPVFTAHLRGGEVEVTWSGKLNTSSGSKIRVTLWDFQGRKRASENYSVGLNASFRFPFPALVNGIYYLHIQSADDRVAVVTVPQIKTNER